jgi:hypothetical protein
LVAESLATAFIQSNLAEEVTIVETVVQKVKEVVPEKKEKVIEPEYKKKNIFGSKGKKK